MKIIDFARIGNVIHFYLGSDDCNDYWGDDWDDAPYEYNAGEVYDEYVRATVDVALSSDCVVLEPCCGVANSAFSKEDFKNRRCPCVIVFPAKPETYSDNDFSYNSGRDDALRIYYGDDIDTVLARLTTDFHAHSFGVRLVEAQL